MATADALRAMEFNEVTPQALIRRHLGGDWGEMPAAERWRNERAALIGRGRVASRYRLDDGELMLVTTTFREHLTIISQPGDEKHVERYVSGWRAALLDELPPVVGHFYVIIPAESILS